MQSSRVMQSWSSARIAAMLVAVGTLAACGGGGGGDAPPPAPPPPESVFVPANQWNGPAPADAETISPDEFRRRVAAGQIAIVTDATPQAQQQARQQQFQQDRAFLEGLTSRSDELNALLAEVAAASGPEADRSAALPGGQRVTLLDLGTRVSHAAATYRRARDPATARAAYAMAYSVLPASARGTLPDPSALATATLDQVDQAATQLDAVLAQLANLDNARLDPTAPVTPIIRRSNAGNGVDNNGNCTPTGLWARYWFPLKRFVSPVKDQGERGTCWAFGAIAAVESRERVQNNNPVDLSEQFLVNKVKREWDENEYVDGYFSDRALNAAVDRNQPLLNEGGWTYNRAFGRPDNAFAGGVAGTDDSYTGACNGYTGMCSESAHQSPRSCSTFIFTVCGYNKVRFDGPGVPASRAQQVWASGRPFQLNHYRALLAAGYSLIASFPVHEGIMAAPNTGIVSDYSRTMRDGAGNLVNGSYGGHVVQVVGFISNEQMSFPGSAPANIGGGGYFIIRNSWGCSAADGGFYYVPADYVSQIFSSLDVLDFDGRRSPQWDAEQVAPGSNDPLQVNGMGSTVYDVRVPSNLAGRFSVTHPVANYVRLTVRSNVDGLLYDGQWMVNQPVGGSLFANALPVNFQTTGSRTLTITARYGSQVVSATKDVVVINQAPTVTLTHTGVPQEGETINVQATIADPNEPDQRAMCAAMQWEVQAPDTIASGEGCLRQVRFGTQGARTLRVTTADREGVSASAVVTYNVGPPPVNPYPRITDFGVFSRESRFIQGTFIGCFDARVAGGATIDLTNLACRTSIFVADQPRYFGLLTLDNPAGEALLYDWTYTVSYQPGGVGISRQVTTRTTTPRYTFGPVVFGARDAGNYCSLRVVVHAPEPARSKALTVWTGLCVNVPDEPR